MRISPRAWGLLPGASALTGTGLSPAGQLQLLEGRSTTHHAREISAYARAVDRRTKKIVFAIVLVVVAPILFLTGGSMAGAVFSGIAIVAFGWMMSRPVGRQLIGNKCDQCKGLITLEYEAEICRECQAGLHARCVESHRASAHAVPNDPPYR